MLSAFPLFPKQVSTFAPQVDALYFFVVALTAFFAIFVVVVVVVFGVKYRDRAGERLGAPIHGSILLELGWSIIPFLIAMVIFVWATVMFFQIVRPSAEALEIYSTGKRWMWRFQPIDGQSEINELHLSPSLTDRIPVRPGSSNPSRIRPHGPPDFDAREK